MSFSAKVNVSFLSFKYGDYVAKPYFYGDTNLYPALGFVSAGNLMHTNCLTKVLIVYVCEKTRPKSVFFFDVKMKASSTVGIGYRDKMSKL